MLLAAAAESFSSTVKLADHGDFKVQVPTVLGEFQPLLMPVALEHWQKTLEELTNRISQPLPHWVCLAACSGAGKVSEHAVACFSCTVVTLTADESVA